MHDSELKPGERVKDVHFTDDTLAVDLIELVWYPRLLEASPEERRNWTISGAGYGIHWPDLDEDLSTEGLLRGAPAAADFLAILALDEETPPQSKASSKRVKWPDVEARSKRIFGDRVLPNLVLLEREEAPF